MYLNSTVMPYQPLPEQYSHAISINHILKYIYYFRKRRWILLVHPPAWWGRHPSRRRWAGPRSARNIFARHRPLLLACTLHNTMSRWECDGLPLSTPRSPTSRCCGIVGSRRRGAGGGDWDFKRFWGWVWRGESWPGWVIATWRMRWYSRLHNHK